MFAFALETVFGSLDPSLLKWKWENIEQVSD